MWICVSGVKFSVPLLAALRWTNWCLGFCTVPASAALDEMPVNQLGSDPLLPCADVSVSMICFCAIGEKDNNKKKWEVLRNI